MDDAAAAAMLAAVKLAGDHVAVVLDVDVRLATAASACQLFAWAATVCSEQLVDFVDAIELLQSTEPRVDRSSSIVRGVRLGDSEQAAQAVVGVFEVAVAERLHELVARGQCGVLCQRSSTRPARRPARRATANQANVEFNRMHRASRECAGNASCSTVLRRG